MQRRMFNRTGFRAEVMLTHRDDSFCGVVENLSLKGLFVRTARMVPVHEQVQVSLSFQSESEQFSFTIPATVARATERGLGLSFSRIDVDSLLHEKLDRAALLGSGNMT